MAPSEHIQAVLAVAEIAVPLAAGILQGVVVMKYLKPRVMGLLGGLASMVHSRANTVLGLVQLGGLLGVVVACSAAYAPQTLAWLQTRHVLPFEPTLLVLRVIAAVAAYLCGTNLVHLTSALSDEPEADTLEPMPLNDRRQR